MKKQFGQFFTTNSDYILQGLEEFVKNKEITDPFAGNQDLIKWVRKNGCKKSLVLIVIEIMLTVKMSFSMIQ